MPPLTMAHILSELMFQCTAHSLCNNPQQPQNSSKLVKS